MTVFEAIKRRRSIGKMTQQRPTREQIERLLEAATHAPYHHKVEPWKFFVLAGKAREELGVVMAESLAVRLGDVGASSVPGSDPTALAIASGTQWSRHTLPSSARFIASLGGGEASSNKA